MRLQDFGSKHRRSAALGISCCGCRYNTSHSAADAAAAAAAADDDDDDDDDVGAADAVPLQLQANQLQM